MPVLFVPAAHGAVDEIPRPRHRQCNGKGDDGRPVVLLPQRAAAHGGRNDGGQPPHGGDQQPCAPRQIGQSREVAQQILGRARYREDQPQDRRALGRGAEQKVQLFQLGRREEHLHQSPSPAPHQREHRHAAQHRSRKAQRRALPRTEGVPAGDLQRLAGDDGHHHLQKHHGRIRQRRPQAVTLHPRAELLRLPGEADQRTPHEPRQRQRQQYKYDHRRQRQCLFLFFGQCALHTRTSFLRTIRRIPRFSGNHVNEQLRFPYKNVSPRFSGG